MRAALWVAVWCGLVSTNVVAVGVDLAVPLTKRVASLDFPCASHACGCRTVEQCRRHCCCHPPARRTSATGTMCHLAQESPRAETVRVSALVAARCQGHPDPAQPSLHRLDPHLPLTNTTLPARAVAGRHVTPQEINRVAVRSDPPDKIPI